MTAANTTPPSPPAGELVCPKCHEAAGDVQTLETGVLAFKCNACGHQWWLFDRPAQPDSER